MGETTILWALLRGLDVGNDRPRQTEKIPSALLLDGLAWVRSSQRDTGARGTQVDCDEVVQDSWGPRPWHSCEVHSRQPGDRIGRAIMLLHVSGPTRRAQIASNVIRGGRLLYCNAGLSPFRNAQPALRQRISYSSVGAEVGSSGHQWVGRTACQPHCGTVVVVVVQIQAYNICLPGTPFDQLQAAHWTPRCRIELRS